MNKITTSSAAAQLERMYDDLNNAFFEGELLPDVIITLKCTLIFLSSCFYIFSIYTAIVYLHDLLKEKECYL